MTKTLPLSQDTEGRISMINTVFENGKALIAFITAGDPDIETTEKLLVDGKEICVHLKLGEKTKIEF